MSDTVSTGSLLQHSVHASSMATPVRVAAVALAVTLTATAAQFTTPLPFTTVPFVLTPLVVVLSGVVLGSRLGALSQMLYLAAGLAGLAVFAPSVTLPPGPARVFGPTGGYLMAYPAAAFVAGWLAERGWDRRFLSAWAAMTAGLAVIFAGGVSWLALTVTGSITGAITAGLLPFVILDIAKMVIGAALVPRAWAMLGRRR